MKKIINMKKVNKSDIAILRATCEAIEQLKIADHLAKDASASFSALDRTIAELEEWCSLWVSESDGETARFGVTILDQYKLENRRYA